MCAWWCPGERETGRSPWDLTWVQSRFWEVFCHFQLGSMVDAMGHSREKWNVGAPYRPQPLLPRREGGKRSNIPSLASRPGSFTSSRFFLLHSLISPFTRLVFPPLLGRIGKNWHLSVPHQVSPSGWLEGRKQGGAEETRYLFVYLSTARQAQCLH